MVFLKIRIMTLKHSHYKNFDHRLDHSIVNPSHTEEEFHTVSVRMFQLKRFDPRVDIADTDNSDNDEGDNVSASSSSVPSSSGSDESDTSSEEDEDSVSDMPRVAIIAPEQPQIGVALKKRRRDYLSDEAIDDLGVDDVTRDVKINSNIRNALKYSSMNIDEAARCWKLPEFLIKNLKEDNYQNFFPIQCLVIPDVIASERHSHLLQCRDGKRWLSLLLQNIKITH